MRLDEVEVALLQSLLDELTVVLHAEADGDDPVSQRLFPTAYPGNDDADAEYRSLTEESLRSERLDRVSACVADLAGGGDVELADPEVARRWIQTLNDLRLALGTRLGVSEDDPPVDPQDPDQQPRVVYYWLTAVQDSVVTGLMR